MRIDKDFQFNDMGQMVEHPSHYTHGNIETIDIIKDSVTDFSSYCHGNILKYVIRYKHKNGIEDLKKARQYLNWLIIHEEVNKTNEI